MRVLFFVCCWIVVGISHAQEDRFWYFGEQGFGIDFGGCEPSLVESAMQGFEGVITVSTPDGEVLFYSNSDFVWNANDELMQNGQIGVSVYNPNGSPPGLSSAAQLAVARNPDDPNIYYLFTADVQNNDFADFQFVTIDMTADNGLGAVVEETVLPVDDITEKLCSVPKADGSGFWVIAHEYLTNRFLAYEVTAAGVNTTPVISEVGLVHDTYNSSLNCRGELKANLEGNRLVLVQNQLEGAIEVFDFDQTTGVISDPILVDIIDHGFGVSFSPNSERLYISTWVNFDNVPNYLYQYDISSGDEALIAASQVELFTQPVFDPFGSIKLAPDGNLYVARADQFIGRINEPDTYGVGCDYEHNAIDLGENNNIFGLNNIWEIPPSPQSSPELDLPESISACNTSVTINAEIEGATSYSWSTGETSPSVQVETSGEVSVEVEVNGCVVSDAVQVEVVAVPTDLPESITLCEGESIVLNSEAQDEASVLWSTGETSEQIEINQEGEYYVAVTVGECVVQDTTLLTVLATPSIDLGEDLEVCEGDTVVLESDAEGSFEWSDGSTGNSITVTESGVYTLQVSNKECASSDTVIVTTTSDAALPELTNYLVCEDQSISIDRPEGWTSWIIDGSEQNETIELLAGAYTVTLFNSCQEQSFNLTVEEELCGCPLYVPNAFTPDGDGINEVFAPVAACELELRLQVYNRWGEKIFDSDQQQRPVWNGSVSGGGYYAPNGVYTWVVEYQNNTALGVLERKTGSVTLLR